nr:hypothetical protein [Tanacetum cinerariifolium]
MSIQEMVDLKQQYLDEMKRLINSDYRDKIKIDELKRNFNSMSIEINKKEKLQQLEQVANLSTYPSKRFNSFCYDDDDEEEYTVIPSKSEDFFDIESECDIPDCDDSQTTNFSTFSNPLFDDSTSSDDELSHEESYLLESLLNRYTLMASSPKFDSLLEEFFGDNISLDRLRHDDPIPLPDILDFSNVVQVFLPLFTYPVISLILLSSESEDTIFHLGISSYHFSSLKPGASHRSGTFMKFIVYPNQLNECPIKILSSTCSLMDQ